MYRGGGSAEEFWGVLTSLKGKGGMVLEISEGRKGDCQFFWMLLKDKYLQEPSWYLQLIDKLILHKYQVLKLKQ